MIAPNRAAAPAAQARQLVALPIHFIANPVFASAEAAERIGRDPLVRATLADTTAAPVPAPAHLPYHLAPLCATRLLSAEQEQALFRSMNYHRYRAAQIQKEIDPACPVPAQLHEMRAALAEAARIRDRLIQANLRLVVSIVKRFCNAQHALDEQVSEGIVSLMRAVDKFDYDRGFRFSTYATRAIRRNLFRKLVQHSRERARYEPHSEGIEDVPGLEGSPREEERRVSELQGVMVQMLRHLDEREQYIVRARFGFGKEASGRTLQELAGELGVCKERVRQLEIRAMEKLRRLADQYQLQRFDD